MSYANNMVWSTLGILISCTISCKKVDELSLVSMTKTSQLAGNFPSHLDLPPSGNNGAYDATVATDPQSGRVWMIYSGVELEEGHSRVSTHLAYSDDGGACWSYAAIINASEVVQPAKYPLAFAKASAVYWQHEVPSIVFDPYAPQNERWRILWHRYLHVDDNIPGNEDRKFTYGWIGTKTAADPRGLTSAPEQKLFSSFGYQLTPEIEAYNDAEIGLPQLKLDDISPELTDAVAYTEPGMVALDGDLYVSMVHRSIASGKVVLIKLDHSSQNWQYVATPLTDQDARDLNPAWRSFSATDLFAIDDRAYLLASPVITLYEGTLLFELDLKTGLIKKDEAGLPEVIYAMGKTPGVIQSGVATFDPGLTASGILTGDALLTAPQFRMYATGIVIN